MEKSLKPIKNKIVARVNLPGSKSMSNRALIIAAMAKGTTSLKNMLFSDDIEACIKALLELEIELNIDKDKRTIKIKGCNGNLPNKRANIYCRDAGTLTRFMIPMCATQSNGIYHFSASKRMMERPLKELLDGLIALGMTVDYEQTNGRMPFTMKPNKLTGGEISICGHKSSQFVSGMLMAAPYAQHSLYVHSIVDHPQPYVNMTIQMMKDFHVEVVKHNNRYEIPENQFYQAANYTIEPDVSTASYFWAVAAITGGEVLVENINESSKQGDIKFLDVLVDMGCKVEHLPEGIKVLGTNNLKGVSVNMRNYSDTFMTIAAIASFADSPTHINGIAHSRLQESNRIDAMATGLKKLGIKVETRDDGISVYPAVDNLKGNKVEGFNDHRIAMSLALIGLRVPDVIISGSECVAKTCPDYFERMDAIL